MNESFKQRALKIGTRLDRKKKWTDERITELLSALEQGTTYEEAGKRFGVCAATVRTIIYDLKKGGNLR